MTPELDSDSQTVGPFTGFGNFLRKEYRDWWNSWRLILVFAIPTLFQTMGVFFGFSKFLNGWGSLPKDLLATALLVEPFSIVRPVLFIVITIFSTMGLLTTEKSTGTLAWNLTKPLGRTGVFVAKWLAATTVLWVAMIVMPVVVSSICMVSYHGVAPRYADMVPILAAALGWVGLWVLLMLTLSLAFESSAAVGGIGIGFWIVPFLFSLLIGQVLGEEWRDWLFDRLATRSPFWAFPLTASDDLVGTIGRGEKWKEVWLWAYGVWFLFLWVLSLRVFNRQEIGS